MDLCHYVTLYRKEITTGGFLHVVSYTKLKETFILPLFKNDRLNF